MAKYVQESNGQFNGSVGVGATAPTSAPAHSTLDTDSIETSGTKPQFPEPETPTDDQAIVFDTVEEAVEYIETAELLDADTDDADDPDESILEKVLNGNPRLKTNIVKTLAVNSHTRALERAEGTAQEVCDQYDVYMDDPKIYADDGYAIWSIGYVAGLERWHNDEQFRLVELLDADTQSRLYSAIGQGEAAAERWVEELDWDENYWNLDFEGEEDALWRAAFVAGMRESFRIIKGEGESPS